MNVDQICEMLKERCDLYYDTQSVINWKFMDVNNLPLCKVSVHIIAFVFNLL